MSSRRQRMQGPVFPIEETERIRATWERYQFLEGTWRDLLDEHVERQLGPLRAVVVGRADIGSNLFKSVIEQTSALYTDQPIMKSGNASSLKELQEAFELGGWWTIANRHQHFVKGMMESLVYVGWDDDEDHPTFELVPPNFVTAEPAPTNKTRVRVLWRAKQRPIPRRNGELAWYWDRWDSDPLNPSFTIWTSDRKKNVTPEFIPNPNEWMGPNYKLRNELGKPILPFVLYHAQGAYKGLWHPEYNQEVIFGTKQVGLLWTAAVHGMLRASWDQRVLMNGKIRGGTTQETGKGIHTRQITADPTSILQADGENVAIDSWGSPLDMDKSERFCRLYENRLAVHFGLSPSDLVIESLNPASGASITVSQSGKRNACKRDQVQFKMPDVQLAAVVAAQLRAHGRTTVSEGFRLRYVGVALTATERISVTQYVKTEINLNVMDETAAYMELHPGTDLDDAEEDLQQMHERSEAKAALHKVKAELNGEDEEDEQDPDKEETEDGNPTNEEDRKDSQEPSE